MQNNKKLRKYILQYIKQISDCTLTISKRQVFSRSAPMQPKNPMTKMMHPAISSSSTGLRKISPSIDTLLSFWVRAQLPAAINRTPITCRKTDTATLSNIWYQEVPCKQDKRLFQCGRQEDGLVKYDKYTCKKWAVGLGYNKNTRYKIHNKQFRIYK